MDDLNARFRSGDRDAVREVYRRYAGAVGTVARSIVHDRELVEEVVQQTFVKAWQAAHRFDVSRELSPWLYAIARRAAIDVVRREGRPTARAHEPEREIGVEAPSFERTWEVFEVRRAVDDLPDTEREVVRLAHLLGFTHPEVAERLGIPVGTVKSRLARAHQRLAAALGHLAATANHEVSGSVQERERR